MHWFKIKQSSVILKKKERKKERKSSKHTQNMKLIHVIRFIHRRYGPTTN